MADDAQVPAYPVGKLGVTLELEGDHRAEAFEYPLGHLVIRIRRQARIPHLSYEGMRREPLGQHLRRLLRPFEPQGEGPTPGAGGLQRPAPTRAACGSAERLEQLRPG